MSLYFMLLDAGWFHDCVQPALSASWQRRSFLPCAEVCAHLAARVRDSGDPIDLAGPPPLLFQAAQGLSFDRWRWRQLAGELLLYGAAELPLVQTAPATLACLLAPAALHETQRTRLAPIQQAHYGSRDLLFAGRPYRPDHAGCNLLDDVARLADYLAGIDPSRWTPEDLQPLADLSQEDRAEELEFARDWLPPLREMYQRARQRRQIVVCEAI